MGKTIGLKQLSQKVYTLIPGLPVDIQKSIGELEDAWDGIIYGDSGHGKTNFTVLLLKSLMLAMPNAKAEYVAYEEGHGKTVQDTMIQRHNMLETVGNRLRITEHLTGQELRERMAKKQSAKIWVIDSIQASGLTYPECKALKEQMVLSKKKKILIYISWSKGKEPKGATAQSVEYYANIKMPVIDFIVFPKSRYGGNKPFVIWEEGAKERWGVEEFNKIIKGKKIRSKSTTSKAAKESSTPKTETHATENIDSPGSDNLPAANS